VRQHLKSVALRAIGMGTTTRLAAAPDFRIEKAKYAKLVQKAGLELQ